MPFLLKDPAVTVDYAIDWGAEYLKSDTIASSQRTIEPAEPGGLVVSTSHLDEAVSNATLAGGEAGKLYRAITEIETVEGLRDRRSILIRVEKR